MSPEVGVDYHLAPPMPDPEDDRQHCPVCQCDAARNLEDISKVAVVTYWRCDRCGHVWTVSRDGRKTVRRVTWERDEK